MENIRGALSFSDVSFSYPDAARPALSGINLSISPGQHIGIVGRVGCGKTSLLQLIMRFFEPSDGTLLLDEYNINQFDPRYLRRHLSYLSQTPELFDGSIYDNLHTDIEELDRERLDAVASATGLRNIVAANEEGYGMRVGPRGIFLSGGERQTVALARTLLRKAEIFLLDEPTAAMDSKLEAQIVADIVPLIAGKTVILATHRPPLLQLVDTIVVMEKGNIIAQGPRDEILRKLTGDNEQKTTNVS